MYALIVDFILRPECEHDFDALVGELLRYVAGEEHTLCYVVHTPDLVSDHATRVFYELYETREAYLQHENTDYVQRFLKMRIKYLAAPVRVRALRASESKLTFGA